MGTKMEIGGEAMHLRSRDPWYEAHAALCAKRRPPLATPPLLEIANVKLATLSHWQHSQPPALRQSKSRYLTNRSITPLNFTLFLRYHPRSSKRGCTLPKLIKLCLSHQFPEADPRPFGKHCKAGQTRLAMFRLALIAMRLQP